MILRTIFITVFMFSTLVNSMELRNGHTVGTKRTYISKIPGTETALVAAEAERIQHVKDKCYFKCTVAITQLTNLYAKYKQDVFLDSKILVTSDGKGNCPSVFVTMHKKDVDAFIADPLIIEYTRYYRADTFNRTIRF